MYHKCKTSRRFFRRRAIGRKRRIEEHILVWSPEALERQPLGCLSKGKVHCSCPMCATKSTKVWGKHSNSRDLYGISDKRKMARLAYSLKEYDG